VLIHRDFFASTQWHKACPDFRI